MKTRTENEEAISEMREEKTIKISEMRKIAEEIQEGKNDDDKSGLNYLATVQGDKTRGQMNILNTANLIGGIFVLLAALVIGLYIHYSISKPLANLSRTANDIGKGNLDAKIEIKSKDEIAELAASFNKMTQDLRVSRDHIISAKKYRSISPHLLKKLSLQRMGGKYQCSSQVQ
jgi:nitrogen fixation/metabolism regulation signal transduction histidine kinase